MNKPQFWTLIGLSGVLLVLMVAHIFLVRQATVYQNTIAQAQQIINQGQASKQILEKIAQVVYQVSVDKQDQQLKDLMARQQITFTPKSDASGSAGTATPAPAPAPAPTTH